MKSNNDSIYTFGFFTLTLCLLGILIKTFYDGGILQANSYFTGTVSTTAKTNGELLSFCGDDKSVISVRSEEVLTAKSTTSILYSSIEISCGNKRLSNTTRYNPTLEVEPKHKPLYLADITIESRNDGLLSVNTRTVDKISDIQWYVELLFSLHINPALTSNTNGNKASI